MKNNKELINETKSEIQNQIKKIDEEIQSCQEHGDWEIESVLITTQNSLKEILDDH